MIGLTDIRRAQATLARAVDGAPPESREPLFDVLVTAGVDRDDFIAWSNAQAERMFEMAMGDAADAPPDDQPDVLEAHFTYLLQAAFLTGLFAERGEQES